MTDEGIRFSSAIVRPPAHSFAAGITTAALGPPDLALARSQHAQYCHALQRLGVTVLLLPPDAAFPDSTFVEDTAVVTQHGALIARPGASTRRGEVAAMRRFGWANPVTPRRRSRIRCAGVDMNWYCVKRGENWVTHPRESVFIRFGSCSSRRHPRLIPMERSHDVTARHAPGNSGLAREAPMSSESGVDFERRARELSLLQEWRSVLDRAGYGTLLSVSPPMLLQVRKPNIDDRWIALSPNGLLIVFEKNDDGGVCSDYHLLPKGAGDSSGPSARVALQAATKYLLTG